MMLEQAMATASSGEPLPPALAPRLPRGVAYAFALTPLLSQPVVNADFFHEPPLGLASEVLGNYLPAGAILFGLWSFHRFLARPLVSRAGTLPRRLALLVPASALVAALASAVVYPLHDWAVPDLGVPWSVYFQRNIGFTCAIMLAALCLEEYRQRADAAEQRLLAGEKHALRVQLDVLRARTPPHFLFNVLNTIASLIRDDANLAEQTVHRLASILRHALESSRHDRIVLQRELQVVTDYLEVQRARYGSRLRYEIHVEPGIDQLMVPPFVLEPLVENAIVHGLSRRTRDCSVHIRALRRDRQLELSVDDDGPGPGASAHGGTRTSLTDLQQRLALLYGEAATLKTRGNERGGFSVELRLPIESEAE
jgi:two-component system, LytTR family, sensor histidine kinase AlgZ